MKQFIIAALCIATTLSSFANPATGTDKKKKNTDFASTLNATVAATGTKVIVTALSELPANVEVTITDNQGNEVYEGKLTKGDLTQSAIFNLAQLGEGTYNIVLHNGKDRLEKKVMVNTNTTKQLSVE